MHVVEHELNICLAGFQVNALSYDYTASIEVISFPAINYNRIICKLLNLVMFLQRKLH